MRVTRTTDENRILERLDSQLIKYGISNPKVVTEITDRPDILLNHDNGRLGIEITRLDYEEYCKWLNTSSNEPYSRAAEVTINLNKMLASIMHKKRKKYQEYKKLRSLNECWLILHNNLFEFEKEAPRNGVPDIDWFERFSCYELQDLECPYDRVLFNLEHSDCWYSLFNKSVHRQKKDVVYSWPSIIHKESMVICHRGINVINLSDNIPKEKFK